MSGAPSSDRCIAVSTRLLRSPSKPGPNSFTTTSPTMKVGPWRFFAGQVPSADFKSAVTVPAGLRVHRSDIEEQTRFTMQILSEQLEANETDWAHCHHVRIYLTEPKRDYREFVRVWREYFPDPAKAPALAYVPSTGIMFHGPVIEIDPSGVAR